MFNTVLAAGAYAANSVWAQAPTSGPAGGTDGGAPPASLLANPLVLLILVLAIFWFVMSRDQRKKKRQHQTMLSNLKKGDRVLTIGGVIGTIVGIKDTEVVLKVDESSNAKVTFVRSAIDRVVASREGSQEGA